MLEALEVALGAMEYGNDPAWYEYRVIVPRHPNTLRRLPGRTVFGPHEYPSPGRAFLVAEDGTRWGIADARDYMLEPRTNVYVTGERCPRVGERLHVCRHNSEGYTFMQWVFAAGLAVEDKCLTRSPDGVLVWRVSIKHRFRFYLAWMADEPVVRYAVPNLVGIPYLDSGRWKAFDGRVHRDNLGDEKSCERWLAARQRRRDRKAKADAGSPRPV